MANIKEIGASSNSHSIRTQLKDIIPEYKAIYLYWLYDKTLLPKQFKNFSELKANYKMFPNSVTEDNAKIWLYEESVQRAIKVLLGSVHKQRMIELYNIYFEKAKTDVQSFKAFVDFSNVFFETKGEDELSAILKGVNTNED